MVKASMNLHGNFKTITKDIYCLVWNVIITNVLEHFFRNCSGVRIQTQFQYLKQSQKIILTLRYCYLTGDLMKTVRITSKINGFKRSLKENNERKMAFFADRKIGTRVNIF